MGHGPCLRQGELVPQVYVLVSQNEGRGSWSTPGIHVPGITNDSVSETSVSARVAAGERAQLSWMTQGRGSTAYPAYWLINGRDWQTHHRPGQEAQPHHWVGPVPPGDPASSRGHRMA